MSNFPPPHQYQHQHRNRHGNQLAEYRCDRATLARQAKSLAGLVQAARFLVAFTGAGVSTAAGLPDYRGAAGALTMRARGSPEPTYRNPLTLRPTLTHMSLVGLERAGLLKRLVSQNTDGIHVRSGFPRDRLAELHGNTTVESCPSCGIDYNRDFRVRTGLPEGARFTGRQCLVCPLPAGDLRHSLILFGDPLRKDVLERARGWCRQADLCLVLGSSLTVNPAARLPLECLESADGKLVVCNLQVTPRDQRCYMRVWAETDSLMGLLMSELGLAVPEWELERRLRIEWRTPTVGHEVICLEPLDATGHQLSYLKSVRLAPLPDKSSLLVQQEPFQVNLDSSSCATKTADLLEFELEFFGNFEEPSMRLKVPRTRPINSIESSHRCFCDLQLKLDISRTPPTWRVSAIEAPVKVAQECGGAFSLMPV